jgi:calcineurin-like phosphoesterase family protein
MSREIWVISDTHFGHENIIKYCNRPYKDSKEMDESILDNWNSVVKDGDIVYHLGDVYFNLEKPSSFLNKLKGRKRLVLGNHDNGKDQNLLNVFQKIMVWKMFPEFGLLLTHVPVHESTLDRGLTENLRKLTNVHGHIHNKEPPSPFHVNVSVEMVDYTPINIEELRIR